MRLTAAVAQDRYPRLADYQNGLPRGLASYPECRARTSLLRQFLESLPGRRPRPEDVPEPMRTALARTPIHMWSPEVHVMAVSLIIADHYALDDARYLSWLLEVNHKYFESLVFRILMSFVSPTLVFPRAGARWAAVHEGSTLVGRQLGPKEGELVLTFPPGLFGPLLLRTFTAVWQAAFEHSKASSCSVELTEAQETRGHYLVRWT